MTAHTLFFTAPYQVAVQTGAIPTPQRGELLIQTRFSAISAGTEGLLYRDQMPRELALDETIGALAGGVQYPVSYGYAAVGEVLDVGPDVDKVWIGRLIFAFYPHASHFAVDKTAVWPLPTGLAAEEALFLPNMETAVSFVMDAQPLIGERVLVLGQGVVGLLTTALLAQFPLAHLLTCDGYAARRQTSLAWGADESLDPSAAETLAAIQRQPTDLSFELSGNPEALNLAIEGTGAYGRILIGSWYGQKRAPLDLGGKFHRAHQTLISSQVSHLKPQWRGRWSKARRMAVAWAQLERLQPRQLITHRFPITRAAEAYQLLDQRPQEALQVIFTY